MPLTSSLITGRIPLPTGQPFAGVKLIFTLSAWDREDDEILLPAALVVPLDETGALPADFRLWRNSEGLHGTHYTVTARWGGADRATGSVPRQVSLGTIQVGAAAEYVLGALLGAGIPAATSSFWVQASAAEVETILAAAEGLGGFTAPGYLAAVDAAAGEVQLRASEAVSDAGRAEAARTATATRSPAPRSPMPDAIHSRKARLAGDGSATPGCRARSRPRAGPRPIFSPWPNGRPAISPSPMAGWSMTGPGTGISAR